MSIVHCVEIDFPKLVHVIPEESFRCEQHAYMLQTRVLYSNANQTWSWTDVFGQRAEAHQNCVLWFVKPKGARIQMIFLSSVQHAVNLQFPSFSSNLFLFQPFLILPFYISSWSIVFQFIVSSFNSSWFIVSLFHLFLIHHFLNHLSSSYMFPQLIHSRIFFENTSSTSSFLYRNDSCHVSSMQETARYHLFQNSNDLCPLRSLRQNARFSCAYNEAIPVICAAQGWLQGLIHAFVPWWMEWRPKGRDCRTIWHRSGEAVTDSISRGSVTLVVWWCWLYPSFFLPQSSKLFADSISGDPWSQVQTILRILQAEFLFTFFFLRVFLHFVPARL